MTGDPNIFMTIPSPVAASFVRGIGQSSRCATANGNRSFAGSVFNQAT